MSNYVTVRTLNEVIEQINVGNERRAKMIDTLNREVGPFDSPKRISRTDAKALHRVAVSQVLGHLKRDEIVESIAADKEKFGIPNYHSFLRQSITEQETKSIRRFTYPQEEGIEVESSIGILAGDIRELKQDVATRHVCSQVAEGLYERFIGDLYGKHDRLQTDLVQQARQLRNEGHVLHERVELLEVAQDRRELEEADVFSRIDDRFFEVLGPQVIAPSALQGHFSKALEDQVPLRRGNLAGFRGIHDSSPVAGTVKAQGILALQSMDVGQSSRDVPKSLPQAIEVHNAKVATTLLELVDRKFTEMSEKLTAIDHRVGSVSSRLDLLEGRVGSIEQRHQGVEGKMSRLHLR